MCKTIRTDRLCRYQRTIHIYTCACVHRVRFDLEEYVLLFSAGKMSSVKLSIDWWSRTRPWWSSFILLSIPFEGIGKSSAPSIFFSLFFLQSVAILLLSANGRPGRWWNHDRQLCRTGHLVSLSTSRIWSRRLCARSDLYTNIVLVSDLFFPHTHTVFFSSSQAWFSFLSISTVDCRGEKYHYFRG